MAGVVTLMADCFIRGSGVGVTASKLGVATSKHFITNPKKKVKLTSIGNDLSGRASLKKRRFGLWKKASELTNSRRIKKNRFKKERFELLKKLSELSIQCSFKDGVIVYSLENNEPMVWPSPDEVWCRDTTWLVSRHHMAGVMTLMVDCFIRGFGVGVATSKLGVATSEIFEHFITNLRKKVKLASIANDRGGRASLKKRRFGLWKKVSDLTNLRRIKKNLYKKERFELLKKLSELSIQCSFKDGVIVFSLENNEPMGWPSPNEVGCRDIIWLVLQHHMAGVITLMSDCFIGGSRLGVATSKLGVAPSE
ncbi:hypothetical protein Gogos_019823, partial [Gossypium gossypioides]|nr:hypothetical protein [Gossypium gossypioides]